LSDGAPTCCRRITRPCFRTCLTCVSRSQAPLCPYTLQLIADQLEGTFGRLRYLFGGDRPSQTAHLTLSPGRIHGRGLEPQHTKSGISRTAPRQLASPLQSLPPILHMMNQNPISGCSKGSRGLSVLLRVARIFTGIAISPSPSLRQRPSRYAIRAGRNLPDKEFRYLRTVIVHLLPRVAMGGGPYLHPGFKPGARRMASGDSSP
jgi:hypothetical protein